MWENEEAKDRIVKAVMEMMGKERNEKVTVREIAQRAGVNIASINYYFRSKEKLMEEVERRAVERMASIYEILQAEDRPVYEKIFCWADELMAFIMEYPGFLYMMGSKVLNQDTKVFQKHIEESEANLMPAVKEITKISNQQELLFKVRQLMAGVIYPVLIQASMDVKEEGTLADKEQRNLYLTSLMDALLLTSSEH